MTSDSDSGCGRGVTANSQHVFDCFASSESEAGLTDEEINTTCIIDPPTQLPDQGHPDIDAPGPQGTAPTPSNAVELTCTQGE